MQAAYEVFNASARKIGRQAPETLFEKIHVASLDIRTPIIASILYVIVVSYFSRINRARAAAAAVKSTRTSSRTGKASTEAKESRFTPFKCVVIAHNVLLCAYSAFTFLSVFPILFKPYLTGSIFEAFCDLDKSIFNSGVNFWVWNFYMSKYYELADTAILLLKGKPSSFLQTFHHSGSIIGMWIMTITHAPAAWIFVLFNSFIHTVMYFYYTLTCFGYRPSWKKLLTSMQITQFLVGNPLGLLYAFMPGCFPQEVIPPENIVGRWLGSQARSLYACLVVNTVFIGSLVVLFTDFSRKTYGKPSEKKSDKKSEKTEKTEKKSVKIEEAVVAEPTVKERKVKKAKAEKVEKTEKAKSKSTKAAKDSKAKSSKSSKKSTSRSRSRPAPKK